MKYSEKLNGYWEEGYHYYLEFCDDRLTVRGYDKGVRIETKISYDAERLDAGERTVIELEDNVLSRDGCGEMMSEIKELAWEDGSLKMLYYYTIMGETLYTLEKVDGGPFRNIIIRDDEFMDKLQGTWEQWTPDGSKGFPIVIKGNNINWIGQGGKFHVISYTNDKDAVHIVPEDLTRSDFGAFTSVNVYPDKLTAYMIIFDMSVPMSVFARKDMLNKIDIPDAAKVASRSTMMREVFDDKPITKGSQDMTFFVGMGTPGMAPAIGMAGMMGMMISQNNNDSSRSADGSSETAENAFGVCKSCGYKFEKESGKFCPECGAVRS